MSDSIVEIRLTRNLRYKLTYVKIFETYLESDPGPDVVELLKALIQAQQSAIAPLSRYLRHRDVNTQELELDQKLMGHALGRDNTRARLRFIYDGLSRAVSWYETQLLDRQMIAAPDLKELLLELGEIDAAKLWHTEAVMRMLRIPTRLKGKNWDAEPAQEPRQDAAWRSRLMEDVRRPDWGGRGSAQWPRPSRQRREK
jgi:hypothetical protein